MYLGILIGVCLQLALPERRSGRLPSGKLLLTAAFFVLCLAVDAQLPRVWTGYPSSNALRLATGLLAGSGLATVLLPVANRFSLAKPTDAVLMRGTRMLALLAIAAGVFATYSVPSLPIFFVLACLAPSGALLGFWLANLGVVGMIAARMRPSAPRPGFAALAFLALIAMGAESGLLYALR